MAKANLPAVPAQAVITSPVANVAFTMPQVKIPTNLPLPAFPSGNGQGNGTGQGDGAGTGYVATGEGIAGSDGRFIWGVARNTKSISAYASDIDAIRNDPNTSAIHWDNFHPRWLTGKTRWASELSEPQLVLKIEDMLFDMYLATEKNPDGNPDKERMKKVACFVILSNFNAPWENLPHRFDKVIAIMRERHTRLCIIAFENEPYLPLAAYVQESGGVIIRPGKGKSNTELAKELGDALPKLDP